MAKNSGKPSIEFHDEKFKKETLRILESFNVDWPPIFGLLARQFRQSKKAIFKLSSRGGYDDLVPAYKKQKERKWGFAYPILKASGQLMDSILSAGHPLAVTEISESKLVLGTEDPVMPFHEFGTKKMSKRRVFFWGPEARTERDLGLPRIAADTIKGNVARQLGISTSEVEAKLERD